MIDYYLLTKPGIIFGNLFTFAAGFALGSKGNFDLQLFFLTLIALGLVIASACVFNNVIDKSIDQKMERTKERALAKGSITLPAALAYGSILGITTCLGRGIDDSERSESRDSLSNAIKMPPVQFSMNFKLPN